MNSYSKEFIDDNKLKIEELLLSVDREGADIEALLKKLENTDFYTAPASLQYHNSVVGGLADHSLNVYYNLKSMIKSKGLENDIPEDSIIICSILHDMSKIRYYEPSIRNKKVYSEMGSKYDNLGNFDWVSEESWKVIDIKDRFVYGTHEENSEYMIRQFIPLTYKESTAILYHSGGFIAEGNRKYISKVYNDNSLGTLLHCADLISTYIDEKIV